MDIPPPAFLLYLAAVLAVATSVIAIITYYRKYRYTASNDNDKAELLRRIIANELYHLTAYVIVLTVAWFAHEYAAGEVEVYAVMMVICAAGIRFVWCSVIRETILPYAYSRFAISQRPPTMDDLV